MLGLQISTVDSGGVTTQLSQTFKVHPEPGKPDHFATSVPPPPAGTPDVLWSIWPDWEPNDMGIRSDGQQKLGATLHFYNAHYLMDSHENVTFGYTGLVQPSPPVSNVTPTFQDQTTGSGASGESVAAPAYTLTVAWNNDPTTTPKEMPSGQFETTLKVDYPTDPEWGAGSVTSSVKLEFDRGTFHFMAGMDGWDCLNQGLPACVAYDPPFPWTVSPGAEKDALPKSVNDKDPLYVTTTIDPARAAFVIGSGNVVYAAAPFSGSTVVEVADKPAFKVSLVDINGVVAKDAKFQVHLCPRYDHFPPGGVARTCTTSPVPSTNGVIESIRVNANGATAPDGQGYMGVEVLHAPANPGDYLIYFETLEAKTYRLRQQSNRFLDRSTAGEYKGAWHLLTVTGVEILDANFQRVDPMSITDSTPGYVRMTTSDGTGPTIQRRIHIEREDGTIVNPDVTIDLTRQGVSTTYLAAITLLPESLAGPQGVRRLSVASTPSLIVGLGSNEAVVSTLAGAVQGKCGVDYKAVLRFRFMKRDGSGLTPYPGDSSRDGELQDTDVGEAAEQQPEIVKVQIQAVDPNDTTKVCDCTEQVGLAEETNTAYKSPTDFFFKGLYGDTKLESNGKINGAYVGLSAGLAPVTLKSVLDSRLDSNNKATPTTTAPNVAAYTGTGGAHVKAVPKGSSRQVKEGPIPQFIEFWVDQRSYNRKRGDPAGDQNWTNGGNGVRDWLEKRVRDFYADPNWTADPEIQVGMAHLGKLTEDNDPATRAIAETTPGPRDPTTGVYKTADTKWRLWQWGVRRNPLPSELSTFNLDEAGLKADPAADTFTHVAIHEARHIWQDTLTDSSAAIDPDRDFLPQNSPTSAQELLDTRYGSPGNLEFDFYHPQLPDYAAWNGFAVNGGGAAKEADAIRLSGTLMAKVPQCLGAASYGISLTKAAVTGGWKLTAPVTWTGRSGTAAPYEGVAVIFERQSGNRVLNEWVQGMLPELTPDPGTWLSLGIDPATVLKQGATVVVRARQATEASGSPTDARVLLVPPTTGQPTSTIIKATLVWPTECGTLTKSTTITVP